MLSTRCKKLTGAIAPVAPVLTEGLLDIHLNHYFDYSGGVSMGSVGSTEPINFEKRVLEPINF